MVQFYRRIENPAERRRDFPIKNKKMQLPPLNLKTRIRNNKILMEYLVVAFQKKVNATEVSKKSTKKIPTTGRD